MGSDKIKIQTNKIFNQRNKYSIKENLFFTTFDAVLMYVKRFRDI